MKKMIFVGAIMVASAGSAQTGTGSSVHNDADMNQQICRTVTDTGSRLTRTRICLTRAEWNIRRREQRENTERTQMRRTPKGSE